MMQTIKVIIALFIINLLLMGCVTSRSTNVYTEGQALEAEDVEEGVVESVEAATIRKDGTIVGSVGGSVIGGIAASGIGGGKGQAIATTGGIILGGLLGHLIEQGVTDRDALKVVVRLQSGKKIVIVQEADVTFQRGERVNVFSSRVDNTKRVAKL